MKIKREHEWRMYNYTNLPLIAITFYDRFWNLLSSDLSLKSIVFTCLYFYNVVNRFSTMVFKKRHRHILIFLFDIYSETQLHFVLVLIVFNDLKNDSFEMNLISKYHVWVETSPKGTSFYNIMSLLYMGLLHLLLTFVSSLPFYFQHYR